MASNVVGNLVVKLTAHTAEFDTQLGKAGKTAAKVGKDIAKPVDEADTSVSRLFRTLSGRAVGGGNVRLFQGLAEASGGLRVLPMLMLGVVGSLAAMVAKSIQFGREIKTARLEAVALGISYSRVMERTGQFQIYEAAQAGLVELSTKWDELWARGKRGAATVFGGITRLFSTDPNALLDPQQSGRVSLMKVESKEREKRSMVASDTLAKSLMRGFSLAGLEGIEKAIAEVNFDRLAQGAFALTAVEERNYRLAVAMTNQANIKANLREMGRAVETFNDPLAKQSREMLLAGATADQFKEAYDKWGELESLNRHKAAVAGFSWAGAATAGSGQAAAMIANSQLIQAKAGLGADSPEERTAKALEYWLPKIKPPEITEAPNPS